MQELPVRKHNRLHNYDYSKNGAYFLTICTNDHKELFGEIVGPVFDYPCCMRLSTIGKIVEKEIAVLSETYPNVFVDKHIVMPNHVHMIVVIDNDGRRDDIGRQNIGRQNNGRHFAARASCRPHICRSMADSPPPPPHADTEAIGDLKKLIKSSGRKKIKKYGVAIDKSDGGY